MSVDLYTAEQVRALDRSAIDEHGIPGYELMRRAAAAAYASLSEMLADERGKHLLVVCGGGNNGGDGYVLARIARLAGHKVDLLPLVPEELLKGDALTAAQHWREVYGPNVEPDKLNFDEYDAIVDAILGTGLQREVSADYRRVIEAINTASCPVLAIDIPSGLSADTGQPLGIAVRADRTVSFIGLKQGLYTGLAADYCGQIDYADLSVPAAVFAAVPSQARRLSASIVGRVLPRRRRCAHKGDFGHVLVVGGDLGMAGAVIMTGSAALRTGAGLVTLATHPAHATLASIRQPELMSYGIDNSNQLNPLLEKATVVAIGPGLGTSRWAQQLFARVLDSALPLVVDADALNLLAANESKRGNWILTPHPGEAARLLGCKVAEIQADRYAAVRTLAERYQAVIVLKGAGSLIAEPANSLVSVCDRGHPGMASGGMGDVLTGIIAAVQAQCNNAPDAAVAGVWLHAVAAEQAAITGERGILATDLLAPLQTQVNNNG
jgi:NAD(P)H-hydrate epimerase